MTKIEEIKKLIDEGFSASQISLKMKMSATTIRVKLKPDKEYYAKLKANGRRRQQEAKRYAKFWGRSYGVTKI
jgi:DNA-binding NarL/FixJ family response regulator